MDANALKFFIISKSIPSKANKIYTNPSIRNTKPRVWEFVPSGKRALKLNSMGGTQGNQEDPAKAAPPTITPPETVEIRFRRRSKRRNKQQRAEGVASEQSVKTEARKKWEDKGMAEKAVELYMGEKGLLFWLNKFAYASIFIVIGGWILFRFVGPSLNLYQLDAPPLPPSSMFNGS